jgi:hypothetical protein
LRRKITPSGPSSNTGKRAFSIKAPDASSKEATSTIPPPLIPRIDFVATMRASNADASPVSKPQRNEAFAVRYGPDID